MAAARAARKPTIRFPAEWEPHEATWLASFQNGAEGHFFTSRNATARSNHIRAEIYGSDGAIIYDNGVPDSVQASLGRVTSMRSRQRRSATYSSGPSAWLP